jgi:hypothetical protein
METRDRDRLMDTSSAVGVDDSAQRKRRRCQFGAHMACAACDCGAAHRCRSCPAPTCLAGSAHTPSAAVERRASQWAEGAARGKKSAADPFARTPLRLA